jgi:hypothetical protein
MAERAALQSEDKVIVKVSNVKIAGHRRILSLYQFDYNALNEINASRPQDADQGSAAARHSRATV